MTQKTEALCQAAKAADAVFQAAIVKQFGKTRQGDMRYRNDLHDVGTRLARKTFRDAVEAYRVSLHSDRVTPCPHECGFMLSECTCNDWRGVLGEEGILA